MSNPQCPRSDAEETDLGLSRIRDLADAQIEIALALGLVRMLTLLPLHSPALEVVEEHIANAYSLISAEEAAPKGSR